MAVVPAWNLENIAYFEANFNGLNAFISINYFSREKFPGLSITWTPLHLVFI
jgi:hypothetical protein